MDNKVIVQLQLFDYQQNVVVIKDGNKVASFKAPITELAHTIKTTANKIALIIVETSITSHVKFLYILFTSESFFGPVHFLQINLTIK